jgi:hypothetical protein
LWFGLATATPATSMSADHAARAIVEACREGRARFTPGWQARVAEIANVATPDVAAAVTAALAHWVLPSASTADDADRPRVSRELDLGWASAVLPWRAAARFNQP